MGFMMQIRPEVLAKLREEFPIGCTVEVVAFYDQYRDIPAGSRGKVLAVDDCGTVHCSFANSVSLGAVYGVDIIQRVNDP